MKYVVNARPGGTFGPFDSEIKASEWGERFFPTAKRSVDEVRDPKEVEAAYEKAYGEERN